MTYEQIQKFFAKYVKYKDWEFYIGRKGEAIYLQVKFRAADNYNPAITEIQYCRKWQLSTWMTKTELVQTAWAAIQRAVLHEAAEQFLYNGADIFNTHMSVEQLYIMRKGDYALEHREKPVVV